MLATTLDPETGCIDLAVVNGALGQDDGLITATLISLFTDARAHPDDVLPDPRDGDRRGWWGDALSGQPGDRFGSRLWLLDRTVLTAETVTRATEYAREALQWMINDGAVRAVDVLAEAQADDVLAIAVALTLPDGATVAIPTQMLTIGGA